MRLANTNEIFEFIESGEQAAAPMRAQLAQRFGIDGCYVEGVQWIREQRGYGLDSHLGRLPVDYVPTSPKIRATANEVTRLTQKAAASTHPRAIYMDVRPPERDCGPDAAFRAGVHETLTNAAVDSSGYLRTAQMANWRRCVFGTWGMGLSLESAGEYGQRLCTFDFDPTCLITDPYVQKIDLKDHPWVIYNDTWTRDRLLAAFPHLEALLKPEQMHTVEQLEPQKMELSRLSENRLFSRYARYSKSKAARIYQVHVRDGYRFDKWYVVVEITKGKKELVNEDDDACPFGGESGLPLAILHGYLRADTMWSWGEPAQLKEDQDKANLVETQNQRILKNYAHQKIRFDKRAYGRDLNPDDIQRLWDNKVGGLIPYEGSDRVRNYAPPEVMSMPPPPPFLMESLDRIADKMREKTHKSPGMFGVEKSHVPNSTSQQVREDADQVASMRVHMDVNAHEYLVGVLHGTTLKMAQSRNPHTLALLRQERFDAQDFAVVADTDWRNPGVVMTIQESTVRNISRQQKLANLDRAAERQMIGPDEYKQAMADDLPLTDADRDMVQQLRKSVLEIVYGGQWQPRPLGRWTQMFIDEAIKAQMSPATKRDPSALQRLGIAIQSQQAVWAQEQVASNPELQATLAQGGGTPNAEQAQQGPQPGDSVSVADLIGALSSGGGSGASASVPAAAA